MPGATAPAPGKAPSRQTMETLMNALIRYRDRGGAR